METKATDKIFFVVLILVFCGAVLLLNLRGLPSNPPQNLVVEQLDSRHPKRFCHRFDAMSTDAILIVVADDAESARKMFAPAVAAVQRVEKLMSTYRPDSEVSCLNRAGKEKKVSLSAETRHVLKSALRFSDLTEGAFDVTYAPIRKVWREGAEKGKIPTEKEIKRALKRVGSEHLIVGGKGARFEKTGMMVDLGGIAKGYAIEQAALAMKKAGAGKGWVDIGGDMRMIGRREDGEKWKVQVRDPRPGDHPPIVLRLADAAVATSGDYARYFRIDEQKSSHIIDPRSGKPVQNVPSATVIAPDAMMADALATSISVLRPEKAIKLVESLDGVECFIMRNKSENPKSVSLRRSSGFNDFVMGETLDEE
ncbi:MAG: FAD:protein FMN transferase [Candidatus Brocadiia bacterium]